jgi:ABC-type nitrate/sulfonate/bicarbonate transport system permease component
MTRNRATVASSSRRAARLLAQIAVIAVAMLVWWYGSVSLPTGVMPSPFATIATLGQYALTPHFWATVGETVATFLVALVICTVVGVPLGLAIGSSRLATQSTRLVFDFLRTIPPIAILPLVLLIFGPTFEMVLVVVVLGAIWPILIQSVYAARQGEPLLVDMTRSFRIPHRWFIARVFFPGSLPFIMTGLRVGTTICLLLTITGELLSGAPGIGFEIADAKNFLDTPRMYAYVLVSALLGLVVNGAFWVVQRRVLRWHASNRQEVAA